MIFVCTWKTGRKSFTIVTGDMNVAHKEIDLKNQRQSKNAGFTDEERESLPNFLTQIYWYVSVFYPDREEIYSWWSYLHARAKMRMADRLFCVSESLKERQDAKILIDVMDRINNLLSWIWNNIIWVSFETNKDWYYFGLFRSWKNNAY